MSKKNKKPMRRSKIILFSVIGAVLLGAAIAAAIIFYEPEVGETYTFVNDAIDNTEAMEEFIVQISSTAQLAVDGDIQVTKTIGYISSKENLDDVYVYLNTSSETPEDPSQDFDVTVAMYTDGEKVYDDSTGKPVEVDMTPEEFNEIVDGYKLYRYREKDCEKVEFDENEIEDFKDGGNVTLTLTSPSDEVLEAYAGKIAEVTGEKVKKGDLTVKSAYVTYSIYDGKVSGQTCTFAVEYICEDETVVQYSVTNQTAYADIAEEDEEMEIIVPETQTQTQEENDV